MRTDKNETNGSDVTREREKLRHRNKEQFGSVASSNKGGRRAAVSVEDSKMVTFGEVKVCAPRKTETREVKRNIKAGQLAFARAKNSIIKHGVTLNVPEGVPLFHADPDRPELIVRVLAGKSERGKFVKGQFKKTVP